MWQYYQLSKLSGGGVTIHFYNSIYIIFHGSDSIQERYLAHLERYNTIRFNDEKLIQ